MQVTRQDIFELINKERTRQIDKFGNQGKNLDANAWAIILGEEFGEVLRAIRDGDSENYITEMVQVATVAIAAIEDYYNGEPAQTIADLSKPIEYKK